MSVTTTNPTVISNNTGNGNIPTVSRIYTFSVLLTANNPLQFDLRSLQNINAFKDAQGIFIDNAANATAATIGLPNGSTLIIPPNGQAMLPLYLTPNNPVLIFTGNGTVNFVLINFPTPGLVWSTVASTIPIIGGLAQVQDLALENLVASGQGSLLGGAPATVSEAVGGVYTTALPTLTNGQQAAIHLSPNSSVLVTTAPMTAVAPSTFTVAVAGTAVSPFAAGSIINGAIIQNPSNAGESLWVDLVNTAQTASPGTNGTTFEVTPGGKFTIPGSMVAVVSVNAATAGHTFAAMRF